MLTPQLKIIKERLINMKRFSIDGTESLLLELQQLEKLLDEADAKFEKTIQENLAANMCRSVTSGPGDHCSCCGRRI